MAHRLEHLKQKLKQRFPGKAQRPELRTNVELDPNWIDLKTIRTWMNICDKGHGDRCKLSNVAVVLPRWLIDVRCLCLVKAKPGARYMALSYVWGQVPCTRALRSNLEELKQPGSISDTNQGFVIPRTIRDAIRLTVLLGEKLLWVDSLCIVQDDVESKHAQLQEMASIYANAYVTLIAANGWDADHGLRGIKGVTETRMLGPNGNQDIIESLQPYTTIWYSRGWTFQELIFSPRKIMFQYQMAMWECACGVWHEATPLNDYSKGVASPDELPPPDFVSCTPFEVKPNLEWPDIQRYMNLVRNYNDRHLTYPEDVIAGFSGVIFALSRVFVGGFIWGLPEMFLDQALLWQPASPLMRRIPSTASSDVSLPSWSWAGWRGDIDQNSWESGRLQRDPSALEMRPEFNTMFDYQVKPVCQWSFGTGKTWRELNIAHYQYLKDRAQYIAGVKKMPHGWRLNRDRDSSKISFSYSFMPQAFYYPVIFGAIGQPKVKDTGHLLSCRTRKLHLYIGEQYNQSRLVCEQRYILTESTMMCGYIILNKSPGYILGDADDDLFRIPCELIAISEGAVEDSLAERDWELKFVNSSNPRVDAFYNVLWIDWVDGIAYRRALGRVAKQVWDSYPDEWVDVILG